MRNINRTNKYKREMLGKALYQISSYFNMIEGEKIYSHQTHNKDKLDHYIETQKEINEIRYFLTNEINQLYMYQDGIIVFIGNGMESFLRNGLKEALKDPKWAMNVGQIDTIKDFYNLLEKEHDKKNHPTSND